MTRYSWIHWTDWLLWRYVALAIPVVVGLVTVVMVGRYR